MTRIGFCTKWLHWIDALVFKNSLSVLVNEFLTEYFRVERGLRQGDPLSHFLFLLALEGLTCLFQNAASINEFQGFHVSEEITFGLL